MATDLLGSPCTAAEVQLMTIYGEVKALLGHDDLPPCLRSNLRIALATLGVAITDLALDFEHLTDYGC